MKVRDWALPISLGAPSSPFLAPTVSPSANPFSFTLVIFDPREGLVTTSVQLLMLAGPLRGYGDELTCY